MDTRDDYPKIDFSRKPNKDLTVEKYVGGGDTTFMVTRDETGLPKGFFKYIHKPNKEITLNGYIQRGARIGTGVPIYKVTEASIYYWSGKPDKPILLGITTTSGDRQPKYYSRGDGSGLSWMNAPVADKNLNELDALDEQNCKINKAIPLNIQGPQSASIPKESKATCLKTTRRIEQVTILPPNNPPGSDYVTTAYMTTDLDTRISRVTYRNQSTDINLTKQGPVSQMRLYSYPATNQVPLMLEFKPSGSGTSSWFYSKGTSGISWGETGDGDGFYNKEGTPEPTDALSDKLDEVLCEHHNNVTLDISYGNSSSGEKYCCGKHQTVHFQEMQINGKGSLGQTKVHKYSINGTAFNLAGLKYYENDSSTGTRKRKKIILTTQFPISVNSIYVFYCKENKPVLIYVASRSFPAKGWYRSDRSSDEKPWKKSSGKLPGEPLENLNCQQRAALREVLEKRGCGNFGVCQEPSQSTRPQYIQTSPSVDPGLGSVSQEYEESDSDEPQSQPPPSSQQPHGHVLSSGTGNTGDSTQPLSQVQYDSPVDNSGGAGGGSGTPPQAGLVAAKQQGPPGKADEAELRPKSNSGEGDTNPTDKQTLSADLDTEAIDYFIKTFEACAPLGKPKMLPEEQTGKATADVVGKADTAGRGLGEPWKAIGEAVITLIKLGLTGSAALGLGKGLLAGGKDGVKANVVEASRDSNRTQDEYTAPLTTKPGATHPEPAPSAGPSKATEETCHAFLWGIN
ncbi:hypothetical protein BEWA_003560 [Theileria equi strain WA]|uniref:Uncharacterized protein n=1 Tax=Theileria equi strain WA TaxID=1537102 RepID=L0B0D8_THEEQ|nr:hypothetical protein BEWA_003560 [Theileria equi strain WA]AFZ80948.1 hypothetical protein BEWA_003560 [Theileria equi strain WA]|eukprot:XP_004830614.1 hypothetical protein BEWA_003560 [Theileria equi strain WA]